MRVCVRIRNTPLYHFSIMATDLLLACLSDGEGKGDPYKNGEPADAIPSQFKSEGDAPSASAGAAAALVDGPAPGVTLSDYDRKLGFRRWAIKMAAEVGDDTAVQVLRKAIIKGQRIEHGRSSSAYNELADAIKTEMEIKRQHKRQRMRDEREAVAVAQWHLHGSRCDLAAISRREKRRGGGGRPRPPRRAARGVHPGQAACRERRPDVHVARCTCSQMCM